jgi:hypothetical protein
LCDDDGEGVCLHDVLAATAFLALAVVAVVCLHGDGVTVAAAGATVADTDDVAAADTTAAAPADLQMLL